MKKIIIATILSLAAAGMWAVPARRIPFDIAQPNGDSITVILHGDEHFHFHTTLDGLLIAKNKKGYYCYAVWKETTNENGKTVREAIAKRKVAKNEADRSKCEKRWIVRRKIEQY